MRATPAISVVMPVRNAAAYVDAAVASIVGQTWTDWELLAIDDGSTDDSAARLVAWAGREPRVRVLRQEGCGLARSVNRGLEEARADWVARMDSDDEARPERLARQWRRVKAGDGTNLCGTWVATFGAAGRHVWRHPVADEGIRARMLFNSPLTHPSVLFERAVALSLGGYRESHEPADDYDLWSRGRAKWRYANVPAALLRYRIHARQTTATAGGRMRAGAAMVRRELLSAWRPATTDAEHRFHHEMCTGLLAVGAEEFEQSEHWLAELVKSVTLPAEVTVVCWRDTVATMWLEVCQRFGALGPRVLRRYLASPLRRGGRLPAGRLLRLAANCLGPKGGGR